MVSRRRALEIAIDGRARWGTVEELEGGDVRVRRQRHTVRSSGKTWLVEPDGAEPIIYRNVGQAVAAIETDESRPGRPPVAGEPRTVLLQARATPAEAAHLDACLLSGESRSDGLRRAVRSLPAGGSGGGSE